MILPSKEIFVFLGISFILCLVLYLFDVYLTYRNNNRSFWDTLRYRVIITLRKFKF